jgi:hypothetical protein
MTEKKTQPMHGRLSEARVDRRRLLKVAVATAPVIATLPTGAALARSSNLIGPTAGPGTDLQGRTLCLDATSGTSLEGGVIDLGTPPSGYITAIRERDYVEEPKGSAAAITEREMCTRGGEFYYKSPYGWTPTKVSRGIVVSATAASSLAGAIKITEV